MILLGREAEAIKWGAHFMTKRYFVSVVIVLISTIAASVVITQYLNKPSIVNPETDRIAFVVESSFPGLSALFLTESIYVTNVDTPGLAKVAQRLNIDRGITWLPQGDKIAYYDYKTKGIYSIKIGDSQPELLWQGSGVLDMVWSPDGSKIAFSNSTVIFLLDIETQRISQLTDETIISGNPTWSPDGNRIAFSFGTSPEDDQVRLSGIAITQVDGSGFVHLDSTQGGWDPAWSPTGQEIAFISQGDIYVINIDTGEIRAVTTGDETLSPTWSPDGRRIAFVSYKDAKCGSKFADGLRFCTSALYVIDADGSNKTLARSKKNEFIKYPVWAP